MSSGTVLYDDRSTESGSGTVTGIETSTYRMVASRPSSSSTFQ
jgi:hypothetical protein